MLSITLTHIKTEMNRKAYTITKCLTLGMIHRRRSNFHAAVSNLRQLTLRACAKSQCKLWGRGVSNDVVERDTTIKVLRFSLVDDKLIF